MKRLKDDPLVSIMAALLCSVTIAMVTSTILNRQRIAIVEVHTQHISEQLASISLGMENINRNLRSLLGGFEERLRETETRQASHIALCESTCRKHKEG